jgi:hypothetical protein
MGRAQAQGSAFSCDGTFYQIRQVGGTSSLFRVDRSNATYTTVPVNVRTVNGSPTNDLGFLLNGLAFNSQDGYLYALSTTGANGTVTNPVNLYKIGQGGIVQVGGPVTVGGTNLALIVATGTFDKTGNYYFSSQNTNGNNFNLYSIKPGSATPTVATSVALNPQVTMYDFAYNPIDDLLYGANWVGSLIRINQATGATTQISTAPNQTAPFAVGTVFFDIAGNLFTYNNGDNTAGTGANFYQVRLSDGAYTTISSINTASVSDGASCINPGERIDVTKELVSVVPVTATSFDVTYTIRLRNTYTATIDNVQVNDFLTRTFPTASSIAIQGTPTVSSPDGVTLALSGTVAGQTAFTGQNGSSYLLAGNQSLTAGQRAAITFTARVAFTTVPNSATAQNNTAYATSTRVGPNRGYTVAANGTLLSPNDLVANDVSTNSINYPALRTSDTDDGDVASPTPLTFAPSISGTVFEDVNYGGGTGRSRAASQGVGRANARVELFQGTGATATFLRAVTTDANGSYSFTGLSQSTSYVVRVVNNATQQVASSRTSSGTSVLLPTQTFANGTKVGGQDPTKVDGPNITTAGAALSTANTNATATSPATTAQSIAAIAFGTAPSPASSVDFGFNFDLIVNTNASGQGSLAQFITNSNQLTGENLLAQSGFYTDQDDLGTASAAVGLAPVALPAGKETSIFMIPSTNLTSGVAVISSTTALPAITGANTVINGLTQTYNIGNTNNLLLGTGGTVGTTLTSLSQLNGPEVQLQGLSNAGVFPAIGLNIAASGTNTGVQGLSILNFGNLGDDDNNAGIMVAATGVSISENVIGTTARAFSAPTTISNADGIRVLGGGNTTTITNNLIGFNQGKGISTNSTNGGVAGTIITDNEIRSNALGSPNWDGIDIQGSTATVTYNLVVNNAGVGIDSYRSAGVKTVTGNTVQGNGRGTTTLAPTETAGVRIYGAGSTVQQNIISGSYGAGIMLEGTPGGTTVAPTSATKISQNSIFNNGSVTATNGGAASGQIGIDLQNNGDNEGAGNSPYVTLNSAATTGANGLQNFPVLTSATLQPSATTPGSFNLVVAGHATAGASIELFIATPNPTSVNSTTSAIKGSNFGQGQTYLTTVVENGTGDAITATATTTYNDASVNGFNQGTTVARAFSFVVPLTAAQAALINTSTLLTSTATVGTTTSEFSGNVPVNNSPVAQNATNSTTLLTTSGAVTLTPGLSGTAFGTTSTGAVNTIQSYTIASLPVRSGTTTAAGTLFYNNGTTNTQLTAANIATTVITNLNGLTFQPAAGYSGDVTFTYTVTDANGVASTTNRTGTGTAAAGPATYIIPVNVAPTATANTITLQNPGGTNSVSIPAASFAGADTAPGVISSLTLTTFPTNATSITINGTTYATAAAFNAATVAARTLTTTANGNLASGQTLSIDPSNGTAAVLSFTVTDNQGATSAPADLTINFTDLTISGTVYNDVNGLNNNIIDGTATGTPGGVQVYVNLVNSAGNVVGSTAVNTNGTYTLGAANGVAQNTTYTLVLTSGAAGTVGSPVTASAPAGFGFTGEQIATTGTDGTPDGRISITTTTTSFPAVNSGNPGALFGLEHRPVAGTATITLPTSANSTIPSASFTGTDVDASATAQGAISSFTFRDFPANAASVTINTSTYTSFPAGGITVGATSPGGNPGQPIRITPNAGASSVTLAYFVTDNGGLTSSSAGSVTVNYPDVATTFVSGPTSLTAGQPNATYVVNFVNNGPGQADGVTRVVTLPAGVTSVVATGGVYSAASNTITYAPINGILAAGQSNNFTFSFTAPTTPAAGLSLVSNITTTTDQNNVTANDQATLNINVTQTLSGVVFEDVNYGGGAGRPQTATGTVVRGGATVELYNASGAYVSSTTTDASGAYSFQTLPNVAYTVRVVNSTVTSSRAGAVAGLLPVQTYNGTTDRVGGEYPARVDAAANTTNATLASLTPAGGTTAAESVFRLTTGSGSAITGPSFGFNFDLVVNTNASGQGSVAQFVTNANTLGGEASLAQSGSRKDATNTTVALPAQKETSIFMIPNGATTSVPDGLRAYDATTNPGLASQLTGGVAVITPTATLTLSGANALNTILDGTTQTFNIGDSNAGTAANAAATTVGVDGVVLAGVQKPEVQISGNLASLLDVEVANATLRGLALSGGNAVQSQTILVGNSASATGYVFESLLVGTTAAGTRPATNGSLGYGINILGQAGVGTLQNSLLAYTGNSGARLNNGTATTGTSQFLSNFFVKNGFSEPGGDGISFGDLAGVGSGPATVIGNSFSNQNSSGIQFEIGQTKATTVINNTITSAGVINETGSVASNLEGAGIVYVQRFADAAARLGTQADVLSKNIITGSEAAGIVVGYGQSNITISQNNTNGNGVASTSSTLGIDLISQSTYAVNGNQNYGNGDGVTLNDGNDATVASSLANRGLDFPIIKSAVITGVSGSATLVVKGYARPGVTAEFFISDADGSGFGEGQTYLGSGVENGTGDLNTSTATVSYAANSTTPNQGADAAAREFTFSLPFSALSAAQQTALTTTGITATATLSGAGTSEFSATTPIVTAPIAQNVNNVTVPNNSGAVTLNPGLSGTAFGTGNSIASYTVTAIPANNAGRLFYNNGTTNTQLTAGNIATTPITNLAGLTFVPQAGFVGTATFTYTVTDVNGVTSTTNRTGSGLATNGPATYTIPVGTPPIANDDDVTTPRNTAITFVVAANDVPNGGPAIDPATIDLDPSTATIDNTFTVTGEGTFTTVGAPTGSVTFTPVSGFVGISNTPYTIRTVEGGLSNQANLIVRVQNQVDVATSILSPAAGTSILAGQEVTLSGQTINNGLAGTVISIIQTVQLPVGLTGAVTVSRNGTSYTAPASYDSGTGVLSFGGANVTAGTPSPYYVRFTAPLTGPFAVAALVTPTSNTFIDSNLANNTATTVLNVTPQYDLYTTITGPTTDPVAGSLISYAITTGNAAAFSPAQGVVQTVSIPAGVAATSGAGVFATNGGVYRATAGTVVFDGVSYAVAANTVTFPPVNLSAGQVVNNTVSFTAPAAGTVLNAVTATVPTTNEAATATLANTATATSVTVRPATTAMANLYVRVAGPGQVAGGTTATYTVTQGNDGPSPADNVQTTASLPVGLTGVTFTVAGAASTAPVYNPATGLVTFPALGSGTTAQASQASVVYTVSFTAPTQSPSLTVTAAVNSTTSDPMVANNMATTQTELIPSADVAINLVLRDGTANVTAGKVLVYMVQTQNNSVAPARGVAQTVALNPGLSVTDLMLNGATGTLSNGVITFGTDATAATYTVASGLLTLPVVATLTNGTVLNNSISFTAPGYGTARASATVSTLSPDPVSTNNSALTSNPVILAADLSVALAGPAKADFGNTVIYAVTTTNNGPSNPGILATPATQTTTVQLPTGLSNVVVTNSANNTIAGAYSATTGIVTFPAATVNGVGQSTRGFITFIMPNVPQMDLSATVTLNGSSAIDADLNNNVSSVSTPVAQPIIANANLATSFPAGTIPLSAQVPGTVVSYGIRTANSGSATAQNPVQYAYLPTGLTDAGLKLNNVLGTAANGIITFTGGATYNVTSGLLSIPLGATLSSTSGANSVTNTVSFPMPATPVLLTVTALADNADATTNNDFDRTLTGVTPVQADVVMNLSGPAVTTSGINVSYAVVATNNGPTTAANVTATFTLPAGVTSYTVNGGASITPTSSTVTLFPSGNTVPTGGSLSYVVSFAAPSTAYSVTAKVTATGDTDVTTAGSNNVATTTTGINTAPVANDVVNVLQSPEGNTATTALALTRLSATDANGAASIARYTLRTLPNPAAGTLYAGGVAVTSLPATGLDVNPATLSFDPLSTFVGSVFFTYTATDNGNGNLAQALTSNVARYTLQVGNDSKAIYTVNAPKGGATPYADGDEIARVYDYNGGRAVAPTEAGKTIFSPNPKDGSANYAQGVIDNGILATEPTESSKTLLTDIGLTVDPIGTISVANRKLLKTGNYSVSVTTTDIYGGVTTQNVDFAIGDNPLPVELSAFTAEAVGNDGQLHWTTASEKNNDHFDVERSLDGQIFTQIAQVAGQGSTAAKTEYALTDKGIGTKVSGTVYYRLRQVDTDGEAAFSPVRTIAFTKAPALTASAISLYPVPARASTTLDLTALPGARTYVVNLTDLSGRLVGHYNLSGGQKHALELTGMASGSYLVTVSGADAQGTALNFVKRLTKE